MERLAPSPRGICISCVTTSTWKGREEDRNLPQSTSYRGMFATVNAQALAAASVSLSDLGKGSDPGWIHTTLTVCTCTMATSTYGDGKWPWWLSGWWSWPWWFWAITDRIRSWLYDDISWLCIALLCISRELTVAIEILQYSRRTSVWFRWKLCDRDDV